MKGMFKIALIALATSMTATPAFAADPGWQQSVVKLILAKHSYPRAAEMRGDEGTARVRISVAADGQLAGVELVEPTGSTILDREAVRLPEKVGTFPAPPGGPASIVLPISWKLN